MPQLYAMDKNRFWPRIFNLGLWSVGVASGRGHSENARLGISNPCYVKSNIWKKRYPKYADLMNRNFYFYIF